MTNNPYNELTNRTMAFSFYRNDNLIGYNWIGLKTSSGAIQVFRSRIDIDISSYNLSPQNRLIRQCEFILDLSLKPIKYTSYGVGGNISIYIDNNEIAHIDASKGKFSIDAKNCSFIYESNFVGIEWLFFNTLPKDTTKKEMKILLVNKLEVIPYILTKIADNEWITNLGAKFITENNLITEFQYPSLGIKIKKEEDEIPEPNWDNIPMDIPKLIKDYVKPDNVNFTLEDITFETKYGKINGSFRIPKSLDTTSPSVLFISGSGYQDRHGFTEEIDLGTHIILDHLANEGILVFSVNDLPVTDKNGKRNEIGINDLLSHFRKAFDHMFLKIKFNNIKNIFLIGHSEGAIISLMLLLELDYDLTGIVLMAPPARRIDSIIKDQIYHTLKHANYTEEQIKINIDHFEEFIKSLIENKEIGDTTNPTYQFLSSQKKIKWLKDMLSVDIFQLTNNIKCPVAIFHGKKDFQVNYLKDGKKIADIISKNSSIKVDFFPLEDVDHLFKIEKKDSTLRNYYDETRPFSNEFLKMLEKWIYSNRKYNH